MNNKRNLLRALLLAALVASISLPMALFAGLKTFKNNGDGTYTATWESDNRNQRCSQMTGPLQAAADGFCKKERKSVVEISPVNCDECWLPVLCLHYGYYRFACR